MGPDGDHPAGGESREHDGDTGWRDARRHDGDGDGHRAGDGRPRHGTACHVHDHPADQWSDDDDRLPGCGGRESHDRHGGPRGDGQCNVHGRAQAMRTIAMVMLTAALGAVALPLSAQQRVASRDTSRLLSYPIPPAGRLVAITNATIMTASKGTIANGTIVIRDGKIAAVGAGIPVPAGAQVIDGQGKYVIPGIVDAHSHSAAEAINEGTQSITAQVRMEDVLRQDALGLYRELAGGVTTLNILHGSANTIGGQNATVKVRWGLPADSLLFQAAPPGIKFALGENVRQTNRNVQAGQDRRYPRSRMGVEELLRDSFTRAQEYRKEWQDYEKAKRAAARGQAPIPPRRDLELDALVEVLEGKRLVHCHSYRSDEILMMIRLADEMGFKVATFQHVLEGYKVAKEIAAHGAGASTFSDWWGYKIEAEDAIPGNAG